MRSYCQKSITCEIQRTETVFREAKFNPANCKKEFAKFPRFCGWPELPRLKFFERVLSVLIPWISTKLLGKVALNEFSMLILIQFLPILITNVTLKKMRNVSDSSNFS